MVGTAANNTAKVKLSNNDIRFAGGSSIGYSYNVVPAKLKEVRCKGKRGMNNCNKKLGEFETGTKGFVQCPDSRCKHMNKIEVK